MYKKLNLLNLLKKWLVDEELKELKRVQKEYLKKIQTIDEKDIQIKNLKKRLAYYTNKGVI